MLELKKLYNVEFKYLLIESDDSFYNFLLSITKDDVIAIDTEFTRRNTYYPKLSTIQIAVQNPTSSHKIITLIDVHKISNIKNLLAILNQHQCLKIIHCALQDLQIFAHLSKTTPNNFIDTQLMAGFCGLEHNIGYWKLVKEAFNIEICKKMQVSDWQKRPLTAEQIDYALVDVLFLHEIYAKLKNIVNISNNYEWVTEEMVYFIKKILHPNLNSLFKKIPHKGKSKIQIAQIEKLLELREFFAQKYDKVREHILKYNDIEKLTMSFDEDYLVKLQLPDDFAQNIKKILANKQIEIKNEGDLIGDEFYDLSLDKIKSLIAKTALKYNINQQLLMNNTQIKNILKKQKVAGEINDWRYKVLGLEIEKILNL